MNCFQHEIKQRIGDGGFFYSLAGGMGSLNNVRSGPILPVKLVIIFDTV